MDRRNQHRTARVALQPPRLRASPVDEQVEALEQSLVVDHQHARQLVPFDVCFLRSDGRAKSNTTVIRMNGKKR
jgi:hypothetical protein